MIGVTTMHHRPMRRPPPRRPRHPMHGPPLPPIHRRRPPHPAMPATDAAQKELARANHLLDAGHPVEAGDVFVRISRLGEQYHRPIQAANLAARAAHAYLLCEAIDRATAQARQAIRLKLQAGDLHGAVRTAQRLIEEMERRGYHIEAQEFHTELETRLGLSLAKNQAIEEVQKADLPAQCPACLGPVRSDEVEWIDNKSARCSFCGSILKAG